MDMAAATVEIPLAFPPNAAPATPPARRGAGHTPAEPAQQARKDDDTISTHHIIDERTSFTASGHCGGVHSDSLKHVIHIEICALARSGVPRFDPANASARTNGRTTAEGRGEGAEMMQPRIKVNSRLRTSAGSLVQERRSIFSGACMTDPADPRSEARGR